MSDLHHRAGGITIDEKYEMQKLIEEVKQLREQQEKILAIAKANMAAEWGGTEPSPVWGYIIDLIKGWTE